MRRRSFLRASSAAALAGLVAGCSSPNEGSSEPTSTDEPADTTAGTTTGDEEETTDSTDGSYTVSMTPVGDVSFESVPESISPYCPDYADMLVALGHGDAIESVGVKGRFHTDAYAELDGVSVDKSSLVELTNAGVSRETLLNIDPDLFLVDPNWYTNAFELTQDDISFLTERAAPFLGNTVFRRTDSWHDYDYYTLYGAFEKVSQIVQEQERYEAFKAFHDDYVGRVKEEVPSEGPRGALVWGGSNQPESFSPYHLSGEGANKKSFHDLNVRDVIANSDVEALSEGQRSEIDYEALLDLDPEVLFVRGHESKTRGEFEDTVVAFMQDHSTASRITAVENGDVYRGGPIYLGPIQHLFLTERFATQLYPDTFSGELFARGELSAVIKS